MKSRTEVLQWLEGYVSQLRLDQTMGREMWGKGYELEELPYMEWLLKEMKEVRD